MKTILNVISITFDRRRASDMLPSWATIARLYNRVPLGITHCRTAEDAKGYTKVLAIIVLAVIMGGLY